MTAIAEPPKATTTSKYSTWLHVNSSAEEDSRVEDGSLEPHEGWHAWVRLPNQFQHRTIRDKALAAKARIRRQLRDPETDGYLILEDELSELSVAPDGSEKAVEELLAEDWFKHFQKAMNETKFLEIRPEPTEADNDPDPERPYEHIEEDQRRLAEIEELPEDERPGDEYAELQRHIAAYNEALQQKWEGILEPLKSELESLGIPALVDRLRALRIDKVATNEFMHYYSVWQWVEGTYDRPGGERLFADAKDLEDLDSDVIDALREQFQTLENSRGNS